MVLLDTCVLVWLASDASKLSRRACELISRHGGALFISAITGFEIAGKYRKERLRLPLSPEEWIERALSHHGVAEAPIDWRIAARSAGPPLLHTDPCDRIIVATAEAMDAVLLTPDSRIRAYPGVRVEW